MEDKKKDSNKGISFSSLFDEIDKVSEPTIHRSNGDKDSKKDHDQEEVKLEQEILSKGSDYAEAVYRRALALAEDLLNNEICIKLEDIDQIRELSKEAIALAENGEQDLVECVFNMHYRNTIDYSLLNIVNVMVLSLEIGVSLGYTSHSLERLAAAAFLHDIGMKSYADLLNLSRDLDDQEKDMIKSHPIEGAASLRTLDDDFCSSIADIVEQEHERIDGSGYPKGLVQQEISEYAQIIGLADVYEALTHQRPQRKSYSPLGALKVLIEKERLFSNRLIKNFIERIGLYPRGTFVELNTKEIALVVGQNLRMPSCPKVRVIYDNHGDKAEQKRKIDLSKGTRIYIIRSI